MLYNPPTGGAANDPYVGKNVAAGIQGSKIPPAMPEFTQREIVNTIAASGQTPSNTDVQQLLRAVRSGILEHYTDTGAVNAPAIAPSPPHTSLVDGLHVRVHMKYAPTGPGVLNINALQAPMQRVGGAALVGNEWAANDVVDLVFNAQRYAFQIVGLTKSDLQVQLASLMIPGGNLEIYATPGTSTLSLASGIAFEIEECRSAGGGGGGSNGTAGGASGGGGGARARGIYTTTSATVLTITTGAAGAPGAIGGGNGGNGGTSSVVVTSGSVVNKAGTVIAAGQTICAAIGGGGGTGSAGTVATTSGNGGTATGGDLNDPGDPGGYAVSINATYGNLGGLGGASPGSSGQPRANQGAAGNSSTSPGIGGNGASNNAAGGAGSSGRVIIRH